MEEPHVGVNGTADGKQIYWPGLCGTLSNGIFWDSRLAWDTSSPDLPQCFQRTIPIWIPSIMLAFCSLFYLPYLFGLPKKTTKKSALYLLKYALCYVLLMLVIVDAVLFSRDGTSAAGLSASLAIQGLTFIYVGFLVHYEHSKGMFTSGVLFTYWLILLLIEIPIFHHYTKDTDAFYNSGDGHRIIFFLHYSLAILQFLMTAFFYDGPNMHFCLSTPRRGEDEPLLLRGKKSSATRSQSLVKEENPELKSTFISRITHFWIMRLILKGFKRPLVFDDLPQLNPSDVAKTVLNAFTEAWNKKRAVYSSQGEVQTISRTGILVVLFKTTPVPLFISAVLRLFICVTMFSNPILLPYLIDEISAVEDFAWQGILIAFVQLLGNILNTTMVHLFYKYTCTMAMGMKTAIITSVYRKSLRLSSGARKGTTSGEIANLMSVDAQKVHDTFFDIHELWAAPIQIMIAMVLLWNVIGISSLSGVAVLLIIAPVNGLILVRKYVIMQDIQMMFKDLRLRSINELLSGIRVIKMYAWEYFFQQRVNKSRKEELKMLKYQAYLNAAICSGWYCTPYLMTLAMFGTRILIAEESYLNPKEIFVSLTLVQTLSWVISYMPMFVAFAAQAYISLGRITSMLQQDDIEEENVSHLPKSDVAIEMKNATFTWDKNDLRDTLKNIDLEVETGSLVAIVGAVGSGKSSLLSAALGEMHRRQGYNNVSGSTAYVPQQAWIQNCTLRDNVTFNKAYSKAKFDVILQACALNPDLKLLPAGDMTEIGERGVNLSGGQKQRVSLARAVYHNADIYLLDDPLSAVDAHVSRHLFDKVIGPEGLLKDKTRLLVTHGLTYLPQVDRIALVSDGQIVEQGTYRELLVRNKGFAEFIRNYLSEAAADDEFSDDEQELEMRKELAQHLSMSSTNEDSQSETETNRGRTVSRRTRRSRRKETMEKRDILESSKLIEEEHVEVGKVRTRVILDYVKSCGVLYACGLVAFFLLYIAVLVVTNLWLSAWSDDPKVDALSEKKLTDMRLGVYGGLGSLMIITVSGMAIVMYFGLVKASRDTHEVLLFRILRAPMSFFDTTPLGRIMNRFSSDMDKVDSHIPQFARYYLYNLAVFLSIIIIISYSTPVFLLVAIPMAILFYGIQLLYMRAFRQLKRIDSIKRSPLFTHFDETLNGVSVIKAFKQTQNFVDKNDTLMDESNMSWYPILVSQRWLGFCLDMMGSFIIFFAAIFALMDRDNVSPGIAALSISIAAQTSYAINMMVRGATELETDVVSVERIHEYSEIESEAKWERPETKPDSTWPEHGQVVFKNFDARYRPGLDLALRNISFTVYSGEKFGVVGRTGAGKSSIALSLYRIIEAAGGAIEIDGVNIANIGLHDLRRKLGIIPQDPVLFSGSFRHNLDPQDAYSDSDIWKAIKLANLDTFVEGLTEGLQYDCGEGGSALSVGQRQLVCLARAILHQPKILILDEATSSVDLETDEMIQTSIRRQFIGCTVITIAHRINTIMDYDCVMVLDRGQVVELDSPNKLLETPNSIFRSMATTAGLI